MSQLGRGVLLLDAASGGGAAFARLARQRGARVTHVTGLALDDPSAIVADVADENDLERAFVLAAERLERVDAVVHLVSVPDERVGLHDLTLAAWQRGVLNGLRAAFLVARRTVEEFLGGGEGGRLVHVFDLSGGGDQSSSGPVVEVTHTGLVALVRSVAKEYGPKGITCNAVLAHNGGPQTAEHAAEVAWTLVTPEGAYVTGEVIAAGAPAGPVTLR